MSDKVLAEMNRWFDETDQTASLDEMTLYKYTASRERDGKGEECYLTIELTRRGRPHEPGVTYYAEPTENPPWEKGSRPAAWGETATEALRKLVGRIAVCKWSPDDEG